MIARTLILLASLRLTLALLMITAGLAVYGQSGAAAAFRWLALPFGLLGLNLVAAVAVHDRLRNSKGLLVFHLGLAALATIAGIGRLLAFDGHVEVTEGGALDVAHVVAETQAPLHSWGLDHILFLQRGFSIDYDAGMRRRATRSAVALPDGNGGWSERVVGDDRPLIVGGYRFYTTHNKGFAPLLTWRPAAGGEMAGAVHLPSYPLNEDRQGNEWTLPGDQRTLALWLELSRPIYDENGHWTFAPPQDARLVVIDGDRRETLEAGQTIDLGNGRLRFDGVTTWMGYRIFYDPSLPWLLAAAGLAVAGLALHALGRLKALTEGPAWREVDHVG